jgi:hypothetical protein
LKSQNRPTAVILQSTYRAGRKPLARFTSISSIEGFIPFVRFHVGSSVKFLTGIIPLDKIRALFQNKEKEARKMTTINSSENSVSSAPPAGGF